MNKKFAIIFNVAFLDKNCNFSMNINMQEESISSHGAMSDSVRVYHRCFKGIQKVFLKVNKMHLLRVSSVLY